MPREYKAYLKDILEPIRKIEKYTSYGTRIRTNITQTAKVRIAPQLHFCRTHCMRWGIR